MDVHLLGPVEVVSKETPVALGGPKQRALLAMLALEAGSTVSVERLIDGLWGDDPPTTAAKLVQLYVSHLRKAMAGSADDGAIVTRGGGYELRVGRDQVDASRFERLLAQGAAREALSLWRGPALANVAKEPFAAPEIRRLDELRAAAVEVAIDQDLEAGRHREVLPELESLLAREPLRERVHAQRMLALYRSGRQADALEAYRQARGTLIEQIGVEPGPELRQLQDAILRQDPSLDPPVQELPGWPGDRTPLFGRDRELERLRALWRRACAGAGAAVVILGAPGMGKTRLAHELAREIRRDHGDVLRLDGDAEALRALAGMTAVARPTLLVLDDLDAAGDNGLEALRTLLEPLPQMPLLALATASRPVAAPVAETLTLGPLAPDAVASLARFYVGAHAGAEPPVERLVAESGGVPSRLHDAIAEWARTAARGRLAEAAARTSAERAGWHVAEDDLVAGVVELQGLRERTDLAAGPSGSPVCPFKGLASFEIDDAGVFFGRERLVADMVARLPGTRMMGVVGPSGSGKSSAVRAGLLAALADGVLPGSEGWPVALIRPGDHPMGSFERAIAELPRSDPWLVAVDQFEEAFTACRDEIERAAFIDALVRCTRNRAVVIIAVRADFYGNCAAYPELSRMLGYNHVLVGLMRRHELRRAIELPARHAGLHVEPELVDALIADVEGEPGGLPLLSTALLELWRDRDGRRLHLAAYERTGGVRGAVARLAEATYERLEPDEREQARRIMLRLAGDDGVRARVPITELDGTRADPADRVLSVLAADRLVTIGDGDVEVAHEALLREWPRLRGWLEDDADGRRLHRHITLAARDWDAAGRDTGELYRGARLAAALDWAAAHAADLNATEQGFLDASRSLSERARRRLRAGLVGVASLLVLAVIAGLVALAERDNARDEAVAAAAQRVGAQALVEDDLDQSLLLAREGLALQDSVQTRSNLLAALLRSPAVIGMLRGDGDRLISLDISPDEQTLAFIDHDGTLGHVDLDTRRPVGPPITISGIAGVIIDAASVGLDFVQFSPDGSRLAVGGGKPVIVDARTHDTLFPLRIRPEWFIYGLRFSSDGRTLLAAVTGPPDWPPMIQRFDARSGRPLGPGRQVADAGDVTLLATRHGRRLVTTVGPGATVVRDAQTLRPLRNVPPGAVQVTLSPDARTLLVGGEDGSVRFLDLLTGDAVPASTRHDGRVVEAIFSADGGTAVSAGADSRLIVWDVKQAAAVETLDGHAGQVTGMAITRDGSTLYTAALDGKVLTWDLSGTHRLGRPFEVGRDSDEVPRYALSPDGRVLAIGQPDGSVTLFDAQTLRASSRFPVVPKGPVRGMAYAPGGGLLVVGGEDGFLALVDPHRGKILERLSGHSGPLFTPSISADGRLMATASGFDTVLLHALPSGRPVGRPLRVSGRLRGRRDIGDVSLSPDGRMLAVTRPPAGGVEIRSVPTLERRASLTDAGTVWDLARFTPDGRHIVGGSYKGWARLWSTENWKPASRKFTGHAGRVEWQSMSPDGRTLATGGPDGTVRLWDLPTQQPLGAPLPGRTDRYLLPQFTPDGAHLFAIATGRAHRWDVRPASWARRACAVAGRNLTRSEWQNALPERDYDPAC